MAPLGPWCGGRIAVAVSGGADSLALAWLLRRWQAEAGDRPDGLLALVVDHGLRPQSADEAALTAARLSGIGVGSRVLTLDGLLPGPRLSERARAARYAAFAKACAMAGIVDLLLGHHRGDQAETVLMRLRAGSGRDGLASMARVVSLPSLRLVRPLLDVPAPRLRATLRSAAIAWVEDPSNSDPRFERARLRRELRVGGDLAERLLDLAARAGSRRDRRAAEDTDRLAQTVALRPEGFALVRAGDPAAMAAAIRVVASLPYPVALAVASRLALEGGTACGAMVRPAGRLARDGRDWLVVREAAAAAAPVQARCGSVWDGRFRLAGPAPAGLMLGALSGPGARAVLPRALLRRWPAAVRDVLPALHRDGLPVAVPHLGWGADHALTACRIAFQPAMPLSRGGVFTSGMTGCGRISAGSCA